MKKQHAIAFRVSLVFFLKEWALGWIASLRAFCAWLDLMAFRHTKFLEGPKNDFYFLLLPRQGHFLLYEYFLINLKS